MTKEDMILPDTPDVQESLEQLGATCDCFEAHGTLCGMLIGQKTSAEWLRSLLDKTPASNDLLAVEHIKTLAELYDVTKQQLNQTEFSFSLLLPEDDLELSKRLYGFSQWCQGFLFGLGLSGKLKQAEQDEEIDAFLKDMLELTRLDEDEESTNENELNFAEITEYVRMGVIYLYETLNPVEPAETTLQ